MITLPKLYFPLTSTPFQRDDTYCEIPPSLPLQPYIRCFWGTKGIAQADPGQEHGLLIPDTCMDLIFDVNLTKQTVSACFCAMDDQTFFSTSQESSRDQVFTFAIRFYAWTACFFVEDSLRGTKNQFYSGDAFLPTLYKPLFQKLPETTSIAQRCAIAEALLIGFLERAPRDRSLFLQAVNTILKHQGRATAADVSRDTAVSSKTLQRLFEEHMGLSPKSFSSLVRYQSLWQELIRNPGISILDAVDRFGYYDQAHLLNDFKKRHLLYPKEALEYAHRFR